MRCRGQHKKDICMEATMNWLRRFFYGRHGSDQLSIFLFIVYFSLAVLSQIFGLFVLYIASWAVFAWTIFRMFSRNHTKRMAENNRFLYIWYRFRNSFKNIRQKFKENKQYRYFNCPSCRQKVRVPRGKGKVSITCPKCRTKFMGIT